VCPQVICAADTELECPHVAEEPAAGAGVVSGSTTAPKLTLLKEGTFLFEGERDFVEDRWPALLQPTHRLFRVNCLCAKSLIGNFGKDGYKVACTDLVRKGNQCLVYSLGSNGQWEYEHEVHKRYPHCQIFTFDVAEYKAPSFVTFVKAKIGSCVGCVTINQLIETLGHTGKTIDLFKIDIETFEWGVIPEIFNTNFKQIQIEIHQTELSHIALLEKHTDDWCLADVAMNIVCPSCLELVFVNKKSTPHVIYV
jgi:hypothetical protein